jgi:hypothetical protein
LIRSTIINIVLRYSTTISSSFTMPPIVMTLIIQVVSMVMDRERDGDGGGGAAVPLSSDEMDLRYVCDSFCDSFLSLWRL